MNCEQRKGKRPFDHDKKGDESKSRDFPNRHMYMNYTPLNALKARVLEEDFRTDVLPMKKIPT